MALDPYTAQLWWNANSGTSATDPSGWGAIEATRLLAQRYGLPFDPSNTSGLMDQIRARVTAEGAGTGSTAATQSTVANRELFGTVAKYLNESGLGELFTIDANGNPGGWLWDQIVSGVDSSAALQVRLEDTDVFKRNYGIISEMRQKAANGEAVYVPTVKDVRDYRVTVRSQLQAAGLPAWFYDSNEDADNLMRQGYSPAEIEQKLGSAFVQVRDADPAMRRAFEQFYGVAEGDGAMAAFFLDKDHTIAKLETATRAAFTAGRGSTLGLDVTRDVAERVANSQLSTGAIESGLADAAALKPLSTESLGEATDITSADVVGGTLLGDAAARSKLERRRIERSAVDRAAGGAAITSRGVVGVG